MSVTKEDYLCLSAMLRARENRMLSDDRAERMVEAESIEDAARLLTECGYPDFSGMDAAGIDSALSEYRSGLFNETERLSPEADYVDAFRIRYDYHNAKAVIKAGAMDTDPAHLLNASGRFPPARLLEDINEEKMSYYPPVFAEAVLNAKAELAKTGNPQVSDFVLDRAYFTELSKLAEQKGNPFFTGYVKLLIDAADLKSAVRTLRMGKGALFLENALIPGGSIDVSRILAAKDADEVASFYAQGPLSEAAALASEAVSGKGMTAFEKACDNAVNTYLKKAKFVSYGPETVVAYLAAVENEITAARMIMTAKLSKINAGVIKERLRELYA
ncbi:MAG: V-type ATPase subunit [Oscillospiraceae bacterium]|nr:V-type ATPase subunit [Oscillospiraceae bacterium]